MSGIDLRHFKGSLSELHEGALYNAPHLRWERCWIGFFPSRYYAANFYYLALEIVIGYKEDEENLFRWNTVKLNLPGSTTFNPALPSVMQWNGLINNITSAVIAFVDNLKVSGIDEETAWKVGRQLAPRLQYFGTQDASRKTKPPRRQNDSAWAGLVFHTSATSITQNLLKKSSTRQKLYLLKY